MMSPREVLAELDRGNIVEFRTDGTKESSGGGPNR
jgi:hypothetical protein